MAVAAPPLSGALRDEEGRLVVMRVESDTGQLVLVLRSATGGIFTFWQPVGAEAQFPSGGMRHGDDVLMTYLVIPERGLLAIPANEFSRPVASLRAIVDATGAEPELFDPYEGVAPLPAPVPAFPEPPEGAPSWWASALLQARRDRAGELVFKKRLAADGGWTDVLVDNDGEQLTAVLNLESDRGVTEEVTVAFSPAPDGVVAAVLTSDGTPELSAAAMQEKREAIPATPASVTRGMVVQPPIALDAYQQRIKDALDELFSDSSIETISLEAASARIVIFSDHHKGARDGADDFELSEAPYAAALAYYLHSNFTLYVLGDVEELWENRPGPVVEAYRAVLQLESKFKAAGQYERFWGNHDDYWATPSAVDKHLRGMFGPLNVREALKIRVMSEGEQRGLLFLAHGHQGTEESDRWSWASRIFVRRVWRPAQRRFRFTATHLEADPRLRHRHDVAMYTWARIHPARPVLIAGHTHRPVFWMSDPLDLDEAAQQIEARIEMLEFTGGPDDQRAKHYAELELLRARKRQDETSTKIDPPCYFNTGCCSFPHGVITGLELADGEIRLVEWADRGGQPVRTVKASQPLLGVLRVVHDREQPSAPRPPQTNDGRLPVTVRRVRNGLRRGGEAVGRMVRKLL